MSGNPYGPGFEWKYNECCDTQSIDGHLESCSNYSVWLDG